jgi:peroxiredoxin
VLQAGDPVPEATVFRNPGEAVSVRELAAEGAILLVFYLFDWSST